MAATVARPSVTIDGMDRIVCTTSGYICLDADGVRAHIATVKKLFPCRPEPPVYRCPSAVAHPDRPYHVGVRRNLHKRAA